MKYYNLKTIFVRKKYFFIVLILLAAICFIGIAPLISISAKPILYNHCVVIDAGHGGIDGGSVGYAGTIEKEINLQYANALKQYLESANIKTVMTRENDDGLYDNSGKSKKLSDMLNREKIINECKPDLVVSIHMNSFSQKSVWGANTFYSKNSEQSKILATYIQTALSKYVTTYVNTPKVGDYFMLNCTEYTSVLVECGFISNPDEEYRLNTAEHRNLVAYSIYCGILLYLGFFNY